MITTQTSVAWTNAKTSKKNIEAQKPKAAIEATARRSEAEPVIDRARRNSPIAPPQKKTITAPSPNAPSLTSVSTY